MPLNVQLRDGVIEATFHGKVTRVDLSELTKAFQDIESRLAVTPDRIADLSDASLSDLQSSEVVHLAEARREVNLKNKVKTAIIAPSPEVFGLARMFSTYNRNPAITISVFKDSASAYKWIGCEPGPVKKLHA